uniref:Dihydroorotate oxidase B, electron transfer subunit n=1 Tax=Candidatus Kentrum sp. DK TaxID=2126562 RepID=A0A450T640_9GAMM|nr:MAG: dihydroorotate oxidase B, electron transfer subunit [Candidatus Kentron sp. DK]VFJ62193.1 MAG: dihydroorotate oxidase B, electron transfer subunit [Candidatus Kentron sp. DK]
MRSTSLFVEDAGILARDEFEGDQVILRILAPRIAGAALPGTFLHVRCDPTLPMRRPLSIMAAEPVSGEITILFKVVGKGTGLLAEKKVGDRLDIIGPIGVPFRIPVGRPRALLLGGGAGIPPMVFLASRLAARREAAAPLPGAAGHEPLLLMGSEIPFPFDPCPAGVPLPSTTTDNPPDAALPDGVTAAMPVMEALGIPSRLASRRGYPGAFSGWVTELAKIWLMAQPPDIRRQTALYACGPEPMLRATARLARQFDLPCQVCLEEFMACGIGACAGCTVPVTTATGAAMRRVCVDGPVFDAREVFGP